MRRGHRLPGSFAAAAAIVLLACVTSPARANFVASTSDPAGDAADGNPAHDLTAMTLDYDRRTGMLSGAIRLRQAPAGARSFLTFAAGRRTPTGCDGYPAGVFGSYTDESGASWLRLDAAGAPAAARGDADKRGADEAVQSFTAKARALAGQRFDCVVAVLSEPGNPANVYDAAGPVDLRGKPALTLRVKRVPTRLRPGVKRSIAVTLSNTGDGAARGVKLSLSRARGLSVKPRKRTVRRLAAGARKTVRVSVRLSRRARPVTRLRIVARSGRLVARPQVRLRSGPSRGGGGSGGGGGVPTVCTRYAPDPFGDTGGSLILVPCVR